MNIQISSKNMDVTNEIKDLINLKLKEIGEYVDPSKPVKVKMEEVKLHFRIQILFSFNGMLIKADIKDHNFNRALSQAVNKIHKKMNKIDYKQSVQYSEELGKLKNVPDYDYLSSQDNVEHSVITRRKTFGIKPMNEQEAILQMELLGHEFFMFFNADSNSMCLLYKRKDGHYGLIESVG